MESVSSSTFPFLQLHRDTLGQVLKRVPIEDLAKCFAVCKLLYSFSTNEAFWKARVSYDFPEKFATLSEKISNASTWLSVYKEGHRLKRNILNGTFSIRNCSHLTFGEALKKQAFLKIVKDKIIDRAANGSTRIVDLKTGRLLISYSEMGSLWSLEVYKDSIILVLENGMIKVLDRDGKKNAYQFEPNSIEGNLVFFSVKDKRIASMSKEGRLCIYDLKNRLVDRMESISFFGEDEPVEILREEFVHYKGKLFGAYDEEIMVWDLFTGRQITKKHRLEGEFTQFFIKGDKIVAIPCQGFIKVFDVNTFKLLYELKGTNFQIGDENMCRVTNDKLILKNSKNETEIWNYHNGECLRKWEKQELEREQIKHLEVLGDQFIIGVSHNEVNSYIHISDFDGKLQYIRESTGIIKRLKTAYGHVVFTFETGGIQIWDFNPQQQGVPTI